MSSEISRGPLPLAGNSKDLVQHLGEKEAALLPRNWLDLAAGDVAVIAEDSLGQGVQPSPGFPICKMERH